MYDISSLQLTPETEQACLSLTWVENPAYRFSRDMVHILKHRAFDNQLNSHDVISRQSNDAIAMWLQFSPGSFAPKSIRSRFWGGFILYADKKVRYSINYDFVMENEKTYKVMTFSCLVMSDWIGN